MKSCKTYKYQIELNVPIAPRYIADMMQTQGNLRRALLSVTDLQNEHHSYGATYSVGEPEEEWSNLDDRFISAVEVYDQAEEF